MTKLQAAKDKQAKYYRVTTDDNRRHIGPEILFRKQQITRKACQRLVGELQATYGPKISQIKINMNQYDFSGLTDDNYQLALTGDINVPLLQRKSARYNADTDTLCIYQADRLVYVNDAGHICNDTAALADCM